MYLKRLYVNEPIGLKGFIIYLVALCYAVDQEQSCIVMLCVYLAFTLMSAVNKCKGKALGLLSLAFCLLKIRLLFFSAASSNRYNDEIAQWFPDYAKISFIDKVEIGFTNTMNNILFGQRWLFIILALLMLAVICCKFSSVLYRLCGLVPVLIPLIALGSPDILLHMSTPVTHYGIITARNYFLTNPYIALFIMCIAGGFVLINLWILSRSYTELIISVGTILLGLMTRVMMGFSPTVWASSQRTNIFGWFSFIITTMYVYSRYRTDIAQQLKSCSNIKQMLNYLLFTLGGLAFAFNYIILPLRHAI
jgi:hypothetical protein